MKSLREQIEEAPQIGDVILSQDLVEVFEGDEASIEEMDEAKLTHEFSKLRLPAKESRELVIKAKIGQADKVNTNNRFYPRPIMEREVGLLQKKIEERRTFSNDQHPRRKATDKGVVEMIDLPTFGSTTFIPYHLWMDESGSVFTIGVVPKTDAGRNYAAVIRAGGRPGFSTRGGGSVKKKKIKLNETEEREVNVIQEDFKLKTFDTVIDQSVTDALPMTVVESHQDEKKPTQLIEETFKSLSPEDQKAVMAALNLTESRSDSAEIKTTMKFSEWKKKFADALAALTEAFKDESITLSDVQELAPELYEGVRLVVAEDLESKVQTQLVEKYDTYLDSIRKDLKEAELDEARAEGIALLFKELGLNKDESEALLKDEALLPILKGVVEELKNPNPNPAAEEAQSLTAENVDEAIKNSASFKELEESLKETKGQLSRAKLDVVIATYGGKFPYKADIFEKNIKPLLVECETEEEIKALYESQVAMLKAAGVAEAPKKTGSAQFLTEDAAAAEAAAEAAKGASKDPAQRMIDEAKESLIAAPAREVKPANPLVLAGK